MKRIVFTLFILLIIAAGCGPATPADTAPEEEAEVPVNVEEISQGNLTKKNVIIGTVKPEYEINLVPKAAGQLVQLHVEKGDVVSANQVLANIDSRDAKSTLQLQEGSLQTARTQLEIAQVQKRLAESRLKNAKESLEQAKLNTNLETDENNEFTNNIAISIENARIQWENAKTNLTRMEELYKIGAISLQELEQAITAEQQTRLQLKQAELQAKNSNSVYEQAKIAVEMAQEDVNQANANIKNAQIAISQSNVQVEQAKNRVNDTVVTAPQAGEIVAVHSKVGEVVGQQPLFTIVSYDTIKVEIMISADQLPLFTEGEKTEVEITALEKTFEGTIAYISPIANDSGLYTVEISVENGENEIKAGMVAKVILEEVLVEDTIVVPTSAILEDSHSAKVFIVTAENRAKEVEVEIIRSQSDYTAVSGELTGGELVVTKGQNILQDGSLLKIVEEGR